MRYAYRVVVKGPGADAVVLPFSAGEIKRFFVTAPRGNKEIPQETYKFSIDTDIAPELRIQRAPNRFEFFLKRDRVLKPLQILVLASMFPEGCVLRAVGFNRDLEQDLDELTSHFIKTTCGKHPTLLQNTVGEQTGFEVFSNFFPPSYAESLRTVIEVDEDDYDDDPSIHQLFWEDEEGARFLRQKDALHFLVSNSHRPVPVTDEDGPHKKAFHGVGAASGSGTDLKSGLVAVFDDHRMRGGDPEHPAALRNEYAGHVLRMLGQEDLDFGGFRRQRRPIKRKPRSHSPRQKPRRKASPKRKPRRNAA